MSATTRPFIFPVLLLFISIQELILYFRHNDPPSLDPSCLDTYRTPFILLADAKGVAGLGKAGGDGQGGSDKAGQQVPPEVYIALTYAGFGFLFSLSVPLLCYGSNMLLSKLLACFGRAPSKEHDTSTAGSELQPQKNQLGAYKGQAKGENYKLIDYTNVSSNHHIKVKPQELNPQLYLNQHYHQHLMQQQYSKYHQSPPFAISNERLIEGQNGMVEPLDSLPKVSSAPTKTNSHANLSPVNPKIINSSHITLTSGKTMGTKSPKATNQLQTDSQRHYQDHHPFLMN